VRGTPHNYGARHEGAFTDSKKIIDLAREAKQSREDKAEVPTISSKRCWTQSLDQPGLVPLGKAFKHDKTADSSTTRETWSS